MKYQMNFGRLAAPAAGQQNRTSFRIAILADLSGRASRGQIESLESRQPWKADVDTLESLLERCELRLQLPLGADESVVDVEIGEMDDFHPDELYDKLELFEELTSLRSRLKNSSTFASAAKEVAAWGEAGQDASTRPPANRSGGTAVPRGKLSDFAQLVDRHPSDRTVATAEDLIRRVVSPHIVAAADPQQDALIAAVDQALSTAMRSVLHHPDFQAVESVWRSVDLLTRRIETSPSLEIVLYDITAEELAADLSSQDNLADTGLYRLIVEQPATDAQQGPLSVLIGNYVFEQTPPHAELLARIAKIAAAAQAPFIAGMSAKSVEQSSLETHPLVAQSWTTLRQLPESVYLGLTVPRFLLRWPYGAKTEPIDPFDFEEFTPQTGLKGMLWGNGAILAGLLLAKTYEQQGIDAMKLGSSMTVDDMPFYYYTDKHGDTVALPCTERLITENTALQLKSAGLMPVLSISGRPEVRLGGFESVGGAMLAGPWAPVTLDLDDGTDVEQPGVSVDEAVDEAVGEEVEVDVEVDEDFDAVEDEHVDEDEDVGDIGGEADDSGEDDELDALLAELETADESTDRGDDDIDPELAEMLEGL